MKNWGFMCMSYEVTEAKSADSYHAARPTMIRLGLGRFRCDEIAEISMETQVALLRAPEKMVIRPVGADREVAVDVRIVAATNRDLRHAVHDGAFRVTSIRRLIRTLDVKVDPSRGGRRS